MNNHISIIVLLIILLSAEVEAEHDDINNLKNVFLELHINGTKLAIMQIGLTQSGYLISEQDFEKLRLNKNKFTRVVLQDASYYQLKDGNNFYISYDFEAQILDIYAGIEWFEKVELVNKQHSLPPTQQTGMFINYDLLSSTNLTQINSDGYFQFNFYHNFIRFNTDLLSSTNFSAVKRLNTQFAIDNPNTLLRIIIGDDITLAGSWGNTLRYTGISVGRNFALDPSRITFPLPQIEGSATLPSRTELFFNDMLLSSQDVLPGEFYYPAVATDTGPGNLRLRVTDFLGQVREVEYAIYATNTLLTPGLTEYSTQLGALRQAFSTRSNQYGDAFLSSQIRIGVTNTWTTEIRAETSKSFFNVGLSQNVLLSNKYLASISTVSSYEKGQISPAILFNISAKNHAVFYGIESRWNHRQFRTVGDSLFSNQLRYYVLFNLGYQFNNGSAANFRIVEQQNYTTPALRLADISFSQPVTSMGRLQLSISRLKTEQNSYNQVSLNFSMTFGHHNHSQTGFTLQQNRLSPQASLSILPKQFDDIGYRFSAAQYEQDFIQTAAYRRTSNGNYQINAYKYGDDKQLNVNVGGAVVFIGDRFKLAPRIQDSFAIVSAVGLPENEVLLNHQVVSKTDHSGIAIISDLMSYEAAHIALNAQKLPLDISIDALSNTIRPPARAGAKVTFALNAVNTLMINLQNKNKQWLPIGTAVRLNNDETVFWIGRDGRVFLSGLHENNVLTIDDMNISCTIEITLAEAKSAQQIPTYICLNQ